MSYKLRAGLITDFDQMIKDWPQGTVLAVDFVDELTDAKAVRAVATKAAKEHISQENVLQAYVSNYIDHVWILVQIVDIEKGKSTGRKYKIDYTFMARTKNQHKGEKVF